MAWHVYRQLTESILEVDITIATNALQIDFICKCIYRKTNWELSERKQGADR